MTTDLLQAVRIVSVVIAALLVVAQAVWVVEWKKMTSGEHYYFLAQLVLTILGAAAVITMVFITYTHAPKASESCVPLANSRFAVVAGSVDPSGYVPKGGKATPANTFQNAITAYESNGGVSTGIFAWDGIGMTILESSAIALSNSGAPTGNAWVFRDLNTINLK